MKTKTRLATALALAFTLPVTTLMIARQVSDKASQRPQGPCDIYAAAGDPCVAAHSSTRALYASYQGPLYQVIRQSDGKSLDIGIVQPTATDAGGYADTGAQDAFCANTYCWITTLYDQSGHGNNLVQAPRGGFNGPAMGGFNNVPVADWAPITIMGHKVYGVFIAPGMGLRWDDAKGTAVDDQAEGQYWVINGQHYNGGCCFDYGNAETDSRDDGNGTMETTYYGNAAPWYHGPPPGPWVMTDQENNLVGCVNPDGSKNCDLPDISWRFVTAIAKGEAHHWTSMGGDSQQGDLKVMFDGPRVNRTYDPMRKQGAILLGNGGDNSNGSQGTFYEGAMTAGGTFPSDATDQAVQANVVAAKYEVARLSIAPAAALTKPPGLQIFAPGSSHDTVVELKNTAAAAITGVKLKISLPEGWSSTVSDSTETSKSFDAPIAPGTTVRATFKITSGPAPFNGDIVASASWKNAVGDEIETDTAIEKVRNVSPIKINEFAINSSDSFIELYNAGESDVDISDWSLTERPTQEAIFSSVKIPDETKLAAHSFYLLGLANSGLAVPAQKGDSTIYVRSTNGMSVGDMIEIDTGSSIERRKIATLGSATGISTTLWQPLPDGPMITIPPGSTNVPYTGGGGGFRGGPSFAVEVGEKLGIGYGATFPAVAKDVERYEVVTVTAVGKRGTQAYLAADAKMGDTNIKVSSTANISVGDKIRLDIGSSGHGVETVTVTKVGTQSSSNPGNGHVDDAGTGLDLEEPLKFNHSANVPFSVRGTGISFQPATAFVHSSNEPLLPLGAGITLDSPLSNDHAINSAVRDAAVTSAGYQSPPAPNQWFGGPALSPMAGSMVLRNSSGLVIDSLNYGGVVDPWAAEGYQGESPGSGCSVPSPSAPRAPFAGRVGAGNAPIRSAGRFPDGVDTGSNCRDFLVQTAISLAGDSAVGTNNVKVASVADLSAGQTVIIDVGANRETATIATVGAPGGTTVRSDISSGADVLQVASAIGFNAGQSITIDSGANLETATVASVNFGRRGFGGASGASITLSAPLKTPHAAEAQVSGSGITFSSALAKAHSSGTQIVSSAPTPGAPNHYARKSP